MAILKGRQKPCFHSRWIHLYQGEVNDSLEFLKSTDPMIVLSFWEIQLERFLRLVKDCSTTQIEWSKHIPEQIKGAQDKFQSVDFHQLLKNFSLGWDKWITQFIFGFPTTGCFSQSGVFPQSDKFKAPTPVSVIWKTNLKRFKDRSKSSGFKNMELLWDEATTQVKEGWLHPPSPFPPQVILNISK